VNFVNFKEVLKFKR